jgi:dihydropteroate synthase
VLQLARQLAQHQPRLMAVLNITPDSFSDGGNSQTAEAALATVDTWKDSYPAIIDIGGESTRPNAVLITAQEEWQRIEAPLLALRERYRDEDLRPKISIDTRKPEIAALALDQHVDIINDVSGFADPGLLEVIQSYDCQVVLMHSLSVPADPNVVLKSKEPPISEICRWFDQQLERFEKAGIDLKRVTLDPGLGFGKTALQSIEILRSVQALHRYNLPILIGHSRKSLLANFGPRLAALRDPETVGVSLAVAAKGIEVLRVHDPILHHRTLLAWNHVV